MIFISSLKPIRDAFYQCFLGTLSRSLSKISSFRADRTTSRLCSLSHSRFCHFPHRRSAPRAFHRSPLHTRLSLHLYLRRECDVFTRLKAKLTLDQYEIASPANNQDSNHDRFPRPPFSRDDHDTVKLSRRWLESRTTRLRQSLDLEKMVRIASFLDCRSLLRSISSRVRCPFELHFCEVLTSSRRTAPTRTS